MPTGGWWKYLNCRASETLMKNNRLIAALRISDALSLVPFSTQRSTRQNQMPTGEMIPIISQAVYCGCWEVKLPNRGLNVRGTRCQKMIHLNKKSPRSQTRKMILSEKQAKLLRLIYDDNVSEELPDKLLGTAEEEALTELIRFASDRTAGSFYLSFFPLAREPIIKRHSSLARRCLASP
jgi:hypothetical protein